MPVFTDKNTVVAKHEGITLTMTLDHPSSNPCRQIFDNMSDLAKFVENPTQIKLDLNPSGTFQIIMPRATLSIDHPKKGCTEFSGGIKAEGLKEEQLQTLWRLHTAGKRFELIVRELPEPTKKDAKATKAAEKADAAPKQPDVFQEQKEADEGEHKKEAQPTGRRRKVASPFKETEEPVH